MAIARILWAYNIEPGLDENVSEVHIPNPNIDIIQCSHSSPLQPTPQISSSPMDIYNLPLET